MFKLTSLNLNGLRSAATKGVADWVAELAPDCICMQEIRVQASDIEGRFEEMAGLKGHFHFAEKKGYAGTAVYTKHAPSDVVVGWGDKEFDAEGRYLELRFDTPQRKFSVISCYFPSGSSGEERQAAKFRFLKGFFPHLIALKARARVRPVRRHQHRAQGDRPEELARQPEEQRLPARGARLDDAACSTPARKARAWSTSTACSSPTPPTRPTPGGATAARPTRRTWAGGWTTTWPRRRPRSSRATKQIYKTIKFSDHAPITVDYDFTL